ncbi:RNA-directed DNA polymerase, eukaryota [Tanacetum coccineum]
MKLQRGSIDCNIPDNDNLRIKSFIAKYTINPTIANGISEDVGSVKGRKLADLVIWKWSFFGAKLEMVIKGGDIAYANMGDPNASIPTPQRVIMRPMFGAFGKAGSANSIAFVSEFPRLFALELDKEIVVANKMGDSSVSASFRRDVRDGAERQQWDDISSILNSVVLSSSKDRWTCDLSGDGEFKVKVIRNFMMTFHRGVLLDSHLCPLCNAAMEDVQHVCFRCDVARVVLRKICRWWDLDWQEICSFWSGDCSWFLSFRPSSRLKV